MMPILMHLLPTDGVHRPMHQRQKAHPRVCRPASIYNLYKREGSNAS